MRCSKSLYSVGGCVRGCVVWDADVEDRKQGAKKAEEGKQPSGSK